MLGGAQEEVPVVTPTLPPFWEVGGGLAELEALRQQRVGEDLLSDAAQQFDAVKRAGGSLLCDGIDDEGRVRKFWRRTKAEKLSSIQKETRGALRVHTSTKAHSVSQ